MTAATGAERASSARPRLGFFTRVLDDAPPAERYRLALEQIRTAERLGFDSAWVAQHHFHAGEGGLPSPFVFLAHAAARTTRLVLGTSIVTLPLEEPLRVAEDAAVLSLLAGGRFELGVGSGGTPSSFPPFGHDPKERGAIYARHLERLREALRGDELTADGGSLYPAAPEVLDTLWQATFSPEGAARIGATGSGLMLSKSQPHTVGSGVTALADTQRLVIDAYTAALPSGVAPRTFASRGLVVVDDEADAARLVRRGIERSLPSARALGIHVPDDASDEELRILFDLHVGTPARIIEELSQDHVLTSATDIVFQSHPVDPPHEVLLRSLELIAAEVAPALGWSPAGSEGRTLSSSKGPDVASSASTGSATGDDTLTIAEESHV
ncbi:Putative FMN-dependent luciferase-like monooxygenase, KPN_01858 family [Microbacterium sp. 8M]|uniref:putative FMN-dependent luciferase-like monooxygenase n=1 Tax=Microbacterium sp. 8M TaxID=2653153 RepID=UPI0012F41341|nr:putative FMN-dependent luciferase-like monooxygenase [Microbacterium sp. 8M]VXA92351.1 Putative FMN-dependent luciferase-like monooxygenase, KPN_01858 family [Microbacterium sp. 8M]